MNYSNDFVNRLIEEEMKLSDNISITYHYPDNITHLLYLIIPAFIMKYGTHYKHLIEECFLTTPIMIDDKQDQIYQAYYFSRPIFRNDTYQLTRGIVLKNYQNIGLMQLLDNLIHEFNHAVNSLENAFSVGEQISVRTGFVYHYFHKTNLSFMKSSEGNILEEVINTRQTEMIVDIIKGFSQYQIKNTIILNTLYAIHHAIDSNYQSNSYLLESIVCKRILQNRTFISTVETLRFQGQIEEIYHFFDSITGIDKSLISLSKYLEESLQLQKELIRKRFFRIFKIQRIRSITGKALDIIERFNNNTIYK